MLKKITNAFNLEMEVVMKCLKDNRKKLDAFFTDLNTPPKIFFFYQPRQFKHKELFLSICKYLLGN